MKEGRKILIRTGLIWSIALLGLFIAQLGLMVRAYSLEKAAFEQNVQNALSTIVQKLENRETIASMVSIALSFNNINSSHIYMHGQRKDSLQVSITPTDSTQSTPELIRQSRDEIMAFFENDSLLHLEILENNNSLNDHHLIIRENLHLTQITDSLELIHKRSDTNNVIINSIGRFAMQAPDPGQIPHSIGDSKKNTFVRINTQGPRLLWLVNGDTVSMENRRILVEKTLNDLSYGETRPVIQRLEAANMDSLVTATLTENGIHARAQYGIQHLPGDSILMASPGADYNTLKNTAYRTKLFPNDIRIGQDDLILALPTQNLVLFKQLGTFGLTVLIFLLVIIIASTSLFRRALSQQRFSRTMIDFINNMTHEFKTPISTISLISENLLFSGVQVEAERLNRYGQIIRDESRRMRGQVEKILQMASLEQGDIELKLESIDVHAMIEQALENLKPQVQQHQGRFRTRLQSSSPIINADRQHLANMLYNLLDNAIKYTPESPDILIETMDKDSMFCLSVKDNGVGLSADDAAHVFEKYFRVSTGNVHNVKGFGLGLAYVSLMANAHGGSISVKSQKAQGSTFVLRLPIERE
ncbi:HAMP domain-containing histidine kinase [bacterium]|nr:HAMP domain-containing histidine kinase [bacterium]